MRTLQKIIRQINGLKADDLYGISIDKDRRSIEKAPKRVMELLSEFELYIGGLHKKISQQKNENMANKKRDIHVTAEDILPAIEETLNSIPQEFTFETIAKLDLLISVLNEIHDDYMRYLVDLKSMLLFSLSPNISSEEALREHPQVLECKRQIKESFGRKQAEKDALLLPRLMSACDTYIFHLVKSLHKEAKIEPAKEFNPHIFFDQLAEEPWVDLAKNNVLIHDGIEKYRVVYDMSCKLHPDNDNEVPLRKKINDFKEAFNKRSNRHILEKRRDSAGITFLKVIASLLTLGVAAYFLFKVKGADFANKIDYYYSPKCKLKT